MEIANADAVTITTITVESVHHGVTARWDGRAIVRRSVTGWLAFFAGQGLRP